MNALRKRETFLLFGCFSAIGFIFSEIKYDMGFLVAFLFVAGIFIGYALSQIILKAILLIPFDQE
jgi:small-conductance mechanosensitive channel